jgi:hypothetical protein
MNRNMFLNTTSFRSLGIRASASDNDGRAWNFEPCLVVLTLFREKMIGLVDYEGWFVKCCERL